MKVERKDGIIYERNKKRGKETVPSKEQYSQTIAKLMNNKEHWSVVLVVRMGCEMGMSRQDIVNAEINNVDRYHERGLWIEISKKVKRGKKYEMRSREVPINSSLYMFIQQYKDINQKYLLNRQRGDLSKPNDEQKVNELFTKGNINWSPHKSRHYFRTQVKVWMRKNNQYDEEVIDAFMGHKPREAREHYGVIDWDYKRDIIDKVFG